MSATPTGSLIAVSDVHRGGGHSFTRNDVDLVVGSGSQALYLDLTSTLPAGTHRLLGAGGVALNEIAPPPATVTSSSNTGIGSGGVVDAAVPTAKLDATFAVDATIQSGIMTAGGTITIGATGKSRSGATATSGGGGGISVGETHADTNVTDVHTTVTIGAGTVHADRNIIITALSDHTVSATASSVGGGVISAKIAETTAAIKNFSTNAIVDGTDLSAGDVLAIRAITNVTGRTSSETYSVGLGAGADSDNTNDDRGVTIDADTLVQIGAGSNLKANSVDIDARVDRITGYARAKSTSYSPIFFGVATAFSDASVNVDSNVDVKLLGSTTRIYGERGVDVQARQGNITITRDAWQLAVALIPPQGSRALGSNAFDSNVSAASGLLITVGARGRESALGDGLVGERQRTERGTVRRSDSDAPAKVG